MDKEKIKSIIENDPDIKQIYENDAGCFKNIIVPIILEADDVDTAILGLLASQASVYDKLLNNIAQYGSKELIEKCTNDINNVFSQE